MFVKAAMQGSPSVFVAEAAALAWGATLLNVMGFIQGSPFCGTPVGLTGIPVGFFGSKTDQFTVW
jgi:hypothetical protein